MSDDLSIDNSNRQTFVKINTQCCNFPWISYPRFFMFDNFIGCVDEFLINISNYRTQFHIIQIHQFLLLFLKSPALGVHYYPLWYLYSIDMMFFRLPTSSSS